MRFIDQAGTVVAGQDRDHRPGSVRNARIPRVAAVYRVQAETFESSSDVNFSDRRTVVARAGASEADIFGSAATRLSGSIGPGPWSSVRIQPPDAVTDSRCRRQWVGPPYVASSLV